MLLVVIRGADIVASATMFRYYILLLWWKVLKAKHLHLVKLLFVDWLFQLIHYLSNFRG